MESVEMPVCCCMTEHDRVLLEHRNVPLFPRLRFTV